MNFFRVWNTKSFLDSGEIKIKPITILVGQNSCGKSSLLRFPAVLSQTANYVGSVPPISFFGENVDYGNFEDVVFGKKGDEISFELSYNVDITGNTRISTIASSGRVFVGSRKGVNRTSDSVIKEATIRVGICKTGNSIKVNRVDVRVENSPISSLYWDNEKKNFALKLFSIYENDEFVQSEETIFFSKEDLWFEKFFPIYESDILSSIISSKELDIAKERRGVILKYYYLNATGNDMDLSKDELLVAKIYKMFEFSSTIIQGIYTSFNIECKSRVSYIGPFRQNPDRIYRNSGTIKAHVGSKGEYVGNILARAFQNDDRALYERISKFVYDYFHYELVINDLGNNYFQLMLKDINGIESNLIDVGFGISQVLPIISEVCSSSMKKSVLGEMGINNIILVEQPELHLHPAAQARLADLFEMCVSSNPDSRFIIETHSEHLISKLQVLIADESCPLTNEMVQILYVDKDDNGCAYIEEMKITENGKFEKEWPSGFFDQGYSLVRQLARAASKRTIK